MAHQASHIEKQAAAGCDCLLCLDAHLEPALLNSAAFEARYRDVDSRAEATTRNAVPVNCSW
jgi:hypothetical protein